jgi:hypothetical protein
MKGGVSRKLGRGREENMKLPERHKRKDLVPDVKLNWKFTTLQTMI